MARFQRQTVPWCSRSSSRRGGSSPGWAWVAGLGVADEGQQRLVQPDALGEQLERSIAQPAGAEGGARRPAPRPAAIAVFDRLLEQGDPGLLPEPVAEERGRVAGHREGRGGRQLGRVVHAGEIVRGDPQVHLERAVRPLQGNIVAGQLQRFGTGDPYLERTAAEPPQAAVQGPVPGRAGHRAGAEVRLAEGGQHADQRDPAMVRPGRGIDPVQQRAELTGQRGERAASQQRGRAVQLQVEAVELDGDAGVGGQGPDGLVQRQRPGRAVDQEQLELGADRDRARPEAGPGEQLTQVGQAALEPLGEASVIALAELLPGDLLSHGRPASTPARGSAGRSAPRAGSGCSGSWLRVPTPAAAARAAGRARPGRSPR